MYILFDVLHLAGCDRARPTKVKAVERRYNLDHDVRRNEFSRAYFLRTKFLSFLKLNQMMKGLISFTDIVIG